MIWTILLIITALIALIVCCIVFVPFGVSCQFSNNNNKNSLNAFFFLFSGVLLRVEYDFAANNTVIRIFGRKIDFNKKVNSPGRRQDDKIVNGGKKSESTGDTHTDEHYKAEPRDNNIVVPGGAADVNPSGPTMREVLDHSPRTGSPGEITEPTPEHRLQEEEKPDEVQRAEPKVQHTVKPEQKDKNERLTDKFERFKNTINRHPAVFFLKQEKLRNRVWRWLIRILKSILRIIAVRRLLVRTELVFDDPSLGGKLFGYYEGIRHAAALYSKKINLFFRPVFIQGDTRIELDFCATTSLWKIGYPLIIAVVTFPYITFGLAWWRFYTMNRQKKKADAKRN